jgi:hypothetical protein
VPYPGATPEEVEEGICQLMAMLWLDGQNDSLAVSGFRTNCLLF